MKSIPIKKYLHNILVKWLTLVLRTTCRVTFADTDILRGIFLLLLHTLMYSLTKFQLYAIFFFFLGGGGGVRPLFFSKTSGLLLEFDSKFYKEISGTTIGTKFVPPLACIFTLKKNFSGRKIYNPGFGRDLLVTFFIWTESEESLEKFLEDIDKFHPKIAKFQPSKLGIPRLFHSHLFLIRV